MINFESLREKMIREHIIRRGVKSPSVLDALRSTPREAFVPQEFLAHTYDDSPLSIGEEQTISQPYIVASMTELLELKPTDRVLEIGTGCGYQTTVLAHLCKHVYSVERIESLSLRAQKTLKSLQIQNVSFRIGDGFEGWVEHAPFDAIIVTAAPKTRPQMLFDQLGEQGRMVIPLDEGGKQTLYRFRRDQGRIHEEALYPVAFVPMLKDTKR